MPHTRVEPTTCHGKATRRTGFALVFCRQPQAAAAALHRGCTAHRHNARTRPERRASTRCRNTKQNEEYRSFRRAQTGRGRSPSATTGSACARTPSARTPTSQEPEQLSRRQLKALPFKSHKGTHTPTRARATPWHEISRDHHRNDWGTSGQQVELATNLGLVDGDDAVGEFGVVDQIGESVLELDLLRRAASLGLINNRARQESASHRLTQVSSKQDRSECERAQAKAARAQRTVVTVSFGLCHISRLRSAKCCHATRK